jgi:hypothetical protein
MAMKYIGLLGDLDWDNFPERDESRPWPGPTPQPRAPFVAAYLVKIAENKQYMSHLHDLLAEHPALAWVLGFDLVASDAQAWGVDMQASLPSRKQFGRRLREMPNEALQFLLQATVHLLATEFDPALLPDLPPDFRFGNEISLDTKHIIAWVKENNPKAFVADRYNKERQPVGDVDCKLGFKPDSNSRAKGKSKGSSSKSAAEQTKAPEPPPSTPTTNPIPASQKKAKGKKKGTYYWGYASGVVATKVPGWGEFVLAELTQSFDYSDPSYFLPLMARTEQTLGFRPQFGALDGAFDAFYVYEYFHEAGGMGAVPFADSESRRKQFDDQGLPLCEAGLSMPLTRTYIKRSNCLIAHECGVFRCPLRFPDQTGEACPIQHKNGKAGCKTVLPTSVGNRIHHELDRSSAEYKRIYDQRPATERINSQAVALGIERPKLRNQAAITNQDTLIYVLINLKALHRVRQRKADLGL